MDSTVREDTSLLNSTSPPFTLFKESRAVTIPIIEEPIDAATYFCDGFKNRIMHIYGCSTAVIAVAAIVAVFVFSFFIRENTLLAASLALVYTSTGATLLARNNIKLKSLADEIESFKRDEAQLQRDNIRLEQDVHELATKNKEFENALGKFQKTEKELTSLVRKYQTENSDLKATVTRLEGATVHIETTALHVLQIQDLEQKLYDESEKAFKDRQFREWVEIEHPNIFEEFCTPKR